MLPNVVRKYVTSDTSSETIKSFQFKQGKLLLCLSNLCVLLSFKALLSIMALKPY